MGYVGGGSEYTVPKIISPEDAAMDFRIYISGFLTSKGNAQIVDNHPALQMLYKLEIAEFLWKNLGISWGELIMMDPADINLILEIDKMRHETGHSPSSGCPLQ